MPGVGLDFPPMKSTWNSRYCYLPPESSHVPQTAARPHSLSVSWSSIPLSSSNVELHSAWSQAGRGGARRRLPLGKPFPYAAIAVHIHVRPLVRIRLVRLLCLVGPPAELDHPRMAREGRDWYARLVLLQM